MFFFGFPENELVCNKEFGAEHEEQNDTFQDIGDVVIQIELRCDFRSTFVKERQQEREDNAEIRCDQRAAQQCKSPHDGSDEHL